MLPSLPAQPLLSLLFPDPGGQLVDLAQLEQRLETAGQLRYARLPGVPNGGGAAATPQLAMLHSSFTSEAGQPLAALVHAGKLLCVTRDGTRGRRLQLWARDQLGAAAEFERDLRGDPQAHKDEGNSDEMELVGEPAAAAGGAQAAAAAAATGGVQAAAAPAATGGAQAAAAAALGAAAAAAQGASASRHPGEAEAAPGSAWQQVEGADFELPEVEGELSIAAAPNQAGRIVLVLQAQQAQQGQQAQRAQQGQPCGGQPAAAAAQPLVLVYDAERQRWSGLQHAALFELSSMQSGSGSGGGSNSVASAARLRKGAPSEPWMIQNATNPTMACSDFFKAPSLPSRRGAAVRAAAAAGLEAMEAAHGAACSAAHSAARSGSAANDSADNRSAEAILASQWRQAVALAADGRDSMVAVWRDWGLPQQPRLGEIAAPETLPYDLRHAQVVRALAAGAAGTAGAAGATGEATVGGPAGAASAGGRASSSGGYSSPPVLLRIAADPSLPPIACPLSAAAQCGELRRLLEVLGEGGQALIGEQQQHEQQAGEQHEQQHAQQQRQQPLILPLAGVAPEEHAALLQLVGCLSGRTHAGLLESTLLLDVARLADLLDAPALLRECLAALGCVVPGPETFAPLLALAEGRQYHAGLQHLKLFYRHALALHILEAGQPLLGWALHGLRAGVDSIVEVCTEVAARWLPQQPELLLGSPAGDLEALSSADWKLAAQQRPAKLRSLLEALLPLWRRQLDAAEPVPGGPQQAKRSKASSAAGGPFQSAAVRPPPPKPASLSDAALQQEAERLLQQLQRALPMQRSREREARTAAAFKDADARCGSCGWAAAEGRARRHRLPG